MQYPIIDLITDAYINNGWTGLDISTGKNLVFEILNRANINPNGIIYIEDSYNLNIAKIVQGVEYSITTQDPGGYIYGFFINKPEYGVTTYNGQRIVSGTNFRFTSPIDGYVAFRSNSTFTETQLEIGDIQTPYEPYSEPKNDFPNRLKLPLPHYFPHPVIDALQRAAAGTQTADDTEILRHYLTPLGIGGI